MGSIYTAQLTKPTEEETTVIKNVQVAGKSIAFRFQWAVASEEQYNIVLRYIATKNKSDPLYNNGVYTYQYDYIGYYMALYGYTDAELEAWLDTEQVLPESIRRATRPSQLLMLHERINECAALTPVLNQYKEIVKWQFHAIYGDKTTVGYVEPGGWYRNQDPELSFRFVSALPYIGRNDLGNVAIEFEVNNG